MKKYLFFLFTIVQTGFSQNRVDQLLDSLSFVSNPSEKGILAQKIAKELIFDDWDRSLSYLEYAEQITLKSNSDESLAIFYFRAGEIYYEKDALDIALEYFLKSEKYRNYLEEATRNKLDHNLGVLYARLDRQEQAIPYFKKFYAYALQKQDSVLIAKVLNNLGTIFLDQKSVDSSMLYYHKALAFLGNQVDQTFLKSYLYTNLGRSYFEKNEYSEAKKSFFKALKSLEGAEYSRTSGWVYNTISSYHYFLKEPDSAISYAQKAVLSLESTPYTFENLGAIKNLYKAYLLNQDYKNAATYFEKYTQIRDSLNVEEKTANIEKIKIDQEYKNKEEIRILKQTQERSRLYIIGLLIFVVVLVLLLLLYRSKTILNKTKLEKELIRLRQKELNADLELKNKELIGKAMIEIHRTEIIQEILEDLKQIRIKLPTRETQLAIDKILNRLSKDLDGDLWKEFEIAFEHVHESFYKKLQAKHPDLNSMDKRLCTMMKLHLTTKEIAQLTGQSVKSIENMRTRLRKKLDLTNTKEDLYLYLSSF